MNGGEIKQKKHHLFPLALTSLGGLLNAGRTEQMELGEWESNDSFDYYFIQPKLWQLHSRNKD